uniref:Uncharacterized protein n=1 Tax=Rhabditophanes sp. KR3021 TaxID=114890 RepID=A0AC35U9H7_9BILA
MIEIVGEKVKEVEEKEVEAEEESENNYEVSISQKTDLLVVDLDQQKYSTAWNCDDGLEGGYNHTQAKKFVCKALDLDEEELRKLSWFKESETAISEPETQSKYHNDDNN